MSLCDDGVDGQGESGRDEADDFGDCGEEGRGLEQDEEVEVGETVVVVVEEDLRWWSKSKSPVRPSPLSF